MTIENFDAQPLASPPPAYLYSQFSDDPCVQAFADAFNGIAQGYLDWFTDTPLGLYTELSGLLLDWVGTNLYGMPRPVIGSFARRQRGAIGAVPVNAQAITVNRITESGHAEAVNDDIYKRVLTGFVYQGDGRQMSIDWIRRRVARFLYGANGGDITVDDLQNVSISRTYLPPRGAIGASAINAQAINTLAKSTTLSKRQLTVSVPASVAANALQALYKSGLHPLPFQIAFKVVIT